MSSEGGFFYSVRGGGIPYRLLGVHCSGKRLLGGRLLTSGQNQDGPETSFKDL